MTLRLSPTLTAIVNLQLSCGVSYEQYTSVVKYYLLFKDNQDERIKKWLPADPLMGIGILEPLSPTSLDYSSSIGNCRRAWLSKWIR